MKHGMGKGSAADPGRGAAAGAAQPRASLVQRGRLREKIVGFEESLLRKPYFKNKNE